MSFNYNYYSYDPSKDLMGISVKQTIIKRPLKLFLQNNNAKRLG
jgi:hypothetical protein